MVIRMSQFYIYQETRIKNGKLFILVLKDFSLKMNLSCAFLFLPVSVLQNLIISTTLHNIFGKEPCYINHHKLL